MQIYIIPCIITTPISFKLKPPCVIKRTENYCETGGYTLKIILYTRILYKSEIYNRLMNHVVRIIYSPTSRRRIDEWGTSIYSSFTWLPSELSTDIL